MILIKSFHIFETGVLYNCFELIYTYLNQGDKIRECYSCLNMMIQAHLHIDFIIIFLIKGASLQQFYLNMKLLQSNTIFKQQNNHEVSCD